jgi:hypothetical protein
MVKTSPSDVWHKPIKQQGRNGTDFICHIADQNEALYVGNVLMIGDDGVMTQAAGMGTADFHDYGITVAEEVADGDTYCLAHMNGGKILHNQKLASTYSIGDAVYQSSTGTWTYADKDTAQSILMKLGFVIGPADRITSTVIKDIDDAFTATEPIDILIPS